MPAANNNHNGDVFTSAYWFDVSMQKSHGMYRLDSLHDLSPESQGGGEGEAAPGLRTPKFRKVLGLQ
jgi:hypothetical protein